MKEGEEAKIRAAAHEIMIRNFGKKPTILGDGLEEPSGFFRKTSKATETSG